MQPLRNIRSWKQQFNPLLGGVSETVGGGLLDSLFGGGLGLLSGLFGGGGTGGSGGGVNGSTLLGPEVPGGAGSINAGSVQGGAGGSGGFGLFGGGGGGGGGGGAAEANAQANNANPQTLTNYMPSLNLGSTFQVPPINMPAYQIPLQGSASVVGTPPAGYSPPAPISDPLETFAALSRSGGGGSAIPFLGGAPAQAPQLGPAQAQMPQQGGVGQAQPQQQQQAPAPFQGNIPPTQMPSVPPNALQMAQQNPQSVIASNPAQRGNGLVPPPPPIEPSMLDTMGGLQGLQAVQGALDNNPTNIANVENMEAVLDNQLAALGPTGQGLRLKKDSDLARLKGEVEKKYQEQTDQAREATKQAKDDLKKVRDKLFGEDTPQQKIRKWDDANNNAITQLSYRNPTFIPSVQFYQQEQNPQTASGPVRFVPQAQAALGMQQRQNQNRLQLAARNLAVGGIRGGIWRAGAGLMGVPIGGKTIDPGAEQRLVEETAQKMYDHAYKTGEENYKAFLKQAELNRNNSRNSEALDPLLKAQQEFAEKEAVNSERQLKDAEKAAEDDYKAQHRDIISNYNADVRALTAEKGIITARARNEKLSADIIQRGKQLGISLENAESVKAMAAAKTSQEKRLTKEAPVKENKSKGLNAEGVPLRGPKLDLNEYKQLLFDGYKAKKFTKEAATRAYEAAAYKGKEAEK